MSVFAFLIEPANYTLEIVAHVYKPLGIEYCFIKGNSEASDKAVESIGGLGLFKRMVYIYYALKSHDVFVTNSYTDRTGLLVLLMNLLLFRKPMAIESDTELHIPTSVAKRLVKHLYLGWLFSRKCIYGFPGGYHEHVRLFTHYGMSKDRVFVMPMVVNNKLYSRNCVAEPKDVFRFVYIGRLIPLKQVGKIIDAYKLLVQDEMPVELHIVGDGVEAERLRQMAEGASGVIFHGAQFGEAKINLLHQMHCLVLYSNFEQWGLVVNEALAAGVPCIVSDRVGCRNDLICGDRPAGIIAKWNDVSSLYDAMLGMVNKRYHWRLYSCNAILRMKHWGYDEYKDALCKYIKKTVGAE